MEFYIPVDDRFFEDLLKTLSEEEYKALLNGTKIIELTEHLNFKNGNIYARAPFGLEKEYAKCILICKASWQDLAEHFKKYPLEKLVILDGTGKEIYRFSKKQSISK